MRSMVGNSVSFDLDGLTALPVTAMDPVEVTGEPSMVAVMVLLPSVVPVKVAV